VAGRNVNPPVLPPFQALLDAHGTDVHRFLIAIIGPVDADDVYQETWLAALRAYPRLREASNLRGWLLTVAHNKAIDFVRARARRAVPVAEVPDVAADAGRSSHGLHGLHGLDAELWSRVRALPPKQRTAVALRFVTDAAYSEVASVMGTSEEAARRNVHEGLTRLRREYTP
jgi:RNA polymerase sigma factor (sigma-70 family)